MMKRNRHMGAGDGGSDCGGDQSSTPIGGEGASAKCSRLFFIPPDCSGGIKLDGTAPSGTAQWFNEQVIKIEIRAKVSSRQYGHDKSYCSQDAVPGINSFDGTIQTRIQCCSTPFSLFAGDTAWLQVYPLGQNGANTTPIAGYALITEDPVIMNLENGDPVEHNYSYVSKGLWTGPTGVDGVFDCCDCCGDSGADFSPAPEPSMLDSDPVTVYRWTAGGEWSIAFDELPPGFVRGPAPDPKTDAGKSTTDLRFVKCVKVAATADLHSHSGIVTTGA